MTTIDRMSAEPYYLQLGRIIESRIRDGEYKPGERLPSESEFCRTWGQDGRSFDYHCTFARSDVVTVAVEAQAVDED